MNLKTAGKYGLLCLCTAFLTMWGASAFADDSHCKNGKRMCLNNNRYECKKHHWELIEECHKPAFCYAEYHGMNDNLTTVCKNAEPCKDGEYACFGSSVRCEREDYENCGRDDEMYQCNNGYWEFVETCPGACVLQQDGTAKCVPWEPKSVKVDGPRNCRSGQMKCDSGNAVMFCTMNHWRYQEVCGEGEVCKKVSDTEAMCVEKKPKKTKGVKEKKPKKAKGE